jgi:hypothetical protein
MVDTSGHAPSLGAEIAFRGSDPPSFAPPYPTSPDRESPAHRQAIAG